jgi:DNA-binding LacI/PurR family transcriptional regulator
MSKCGKSGTLEREQGKPLYVVVRDRLRAQIEAGDYAPGDRLPSTKDLSKQLKVSLVTAHRALQELVAAGVLQRGQGKGTYVHEDFGEQGRRGVACRVGLVFHAESSLADSYHGQILEGVRRRANELGVDLVLLRFGEDWRNECQAYLYVNPMREQLEKPPRGGKRGEPGEEPVMAVGATFDVPGVTSIDVDNVEIGASAVRELVAMGHRKLAFLGGSGDVSNDRDRFLGFEGELRRAGLELDPTHVLRHASWRLDEAGRERLRHLLTRPGAPTAIFAAGYYFALDVYAVASAAGLHVPEELSVVGVDDPPSAAHLSPPLSTFRQPLLELGRLATDRLWSIVRGEVGSKESHIMLKAEYKARGSCAGPRQERGNPSVRVVVKS